MDPEHQQNFAKQRDQILNQFATHKNEYQAEDLVDICIMIDSTNSMNPYIEKTRDQLSKIIENVNKTYPDAKFRFSVVAYRDYDEDELEQFEIQNWTNDQQAKIFLGALKAEGGSDFAEDINGAFQQVLTRIPWLRRTNLIIHVCDAPCHNLEYNNLKKSNQNDKYKNGAPYDVEYKDLFELMNKLGIHYYLLLTGDQTDLSDFMIKKFEEIWNTMQKVKETTFNSISIEKITVDKFQEVIQTGIVQTMQHSKKNKNKNFQYPDLNNNDVKIEENNHYVANQNVNNNYQQVQQLQVKEEEIDFNVPDTKERDRK